jgi:hypothetical protein
VNIRWWPGAALALLNLPRADAEAIDPVPTLTPPADAAAWIPVPQWRDAMRDVARSAPRVSLRIFERDF